MTRWEFARRVLPFHDVAEAEVYARLIDGRAQLWVAPDAAGVTEVTDENRFHLWLGGGSLGGLLVLRPGVEAFARHMGCGGIEVAGRMGWRRIFAKLGYVQEGGKMVKTL